MVTLRFYPDSIPLFANEPTHERFEIVRNGDHIGEGVRSRVSFSSGEVIFQFAGHLVPEITQFSLQVRPGLHLHDPYFMGKILHSCDPNAVVDMENLIFTAVKSILPGDYITMDYAQTEDVLFKTFVCSCGASNCRGFVTGRNQDQAMPLNMYPTTRTEPGSYSENSLDKPTL